MKLISDKKKHWWKQVYLMEWWCHSGRYQNSYCLYIFAKHTSKEYKQLLEADADWNMIFAEQSLQWVSFHRQEVFLFHEHGVKLFIWSQCMRCSVRWCWNLGCSHSGTALPSQHQRYTAPHSTSRPPTSALLQQRTLKDLKTSETGLLPIKYVFSGKCVPTPAFIELDL